MMLNNPQLKSILRTPLPKALAQNACRQMSVAFNIKDKFEAAYQAKQGGKQDATS
jgi:hypothetical protein